MKQRFYFKSLLIALFVLFGGGVISATEETITFSELYESTHTMNGEVQGNGITISFNKGTNNNAPTYYTSGTAVRAYGGNYFTVTSAFKITKIVIRFGSSDGSNSITTNGGTYSSGTWTGNAESVTFTVGGSSGNRRIASITVTYGSEQEQDKITPTLTFGQEVVNMFVGDEYTPSLNKPTGVEVSYSIEDEAIATLYDTGHLKALKVGTTTVTATSVENESYLSNTATFTLNVTEKLSAEGTYEWVKEASTLAAGDELVFVFNVENPPIAMGPQRTDYNNFGYTEVSYPEGITDKSILNVSSGNVTAIMLEGNDDAWYFHTNNGYLYASSSSSNQLKTATLETAGNNAKASISISDGNATVQFRGSNSRNLLKYNDTNNLFSCYASGQKYIQIYRKVPSNVPPTITFSPASGTEVNYGTQVTISARTAKSITYSVNDGKSVTVEETSATVTINTHSTIKATATNQYGTSEETTAEYTIHAESPAFTYDPAEYTITFGDEFKAPELGKADGYDGTVTFASNNTAVAEVNAETGDVTVKGVGTAMITATGTATEHFEAATASYTLTVNKQASAVSFAKPVVEITYGDNYDKQNATAQGFSGDLVYTSSDKTVVKFHGNNVIDVLKPGTVTITATAPATETTEESSATYTLIVYAPAGAVEGSAKVLNEEFEDCTGGRPTGDYWYGSNQDIVNLPTTSGWTVSNPTNAAGKGCLKLGTNNNAGDATSPSFILNGTAPLTFDIAPWTSSSDGSITGAKSVTITLTNAKFEDGSTIKTVGQVEGHPFQTTFVIGWNHYAFNIKGSGEGDVAINFHGSSQFFLDNVVVGGGAQPAHEINLTFSSAGYLTWVATADIDFEATAGVTAYQITEATPQGITAEEVKKAPKGAALLLNGTALLLNGTGTVELKRTSGVSSLTNNKMQACTDTPVTGITGSATSTDKYVLGNGGNGLGFYMLKNTLQAGKGYLSISGGASAKATFIGFEETTGICNVSETSEEEGVCYNLQGVRVMNPQKGVYIKNGKKVVVK